MGQIEISDLSILLVEPSPTQNKMIVKHLREEGVNKIEGMGSGGDALKLLQGFTPDLVISAMYLPDMTATELISRIRESMNLPELAFMLISSETCFDRLDPIRQAGVVAILPKPFDHEDLKRGLAATVDVIDPEAMELDLYDIEQLKVLVIDDSPLARKFITRTLTNLGIRDITQAEGGGQAVEILSSQQFDLIVTDFNMPCMDGKQLTEFVRRKLQNLHTPILMVTSEQDVATLTSIQQSGVSAIMDKPFEPRCVQEVLARIMDSEIS